MTRENPGTDNGGPVRQIPLEDGALWRVELATPKANIIDAEKIRILTDVFRQAAREPGLRGIILGAQGPHFSFGASVEEHFPDRVEEMLTGFHGLFYAMLDAAVPTLAAVRGQCLGGGLELASFCNRVFVAPDARLGQPEIVLGVFAPVASVVLGERVGRGRAEDICLSGRSLNAEEARAAGLVDELADDPDAAALEYARKHLLPKSASSLRYAVRAARHGFAERVRRELPEVERLYLRDLMATEDPIEGLSAFVEKRQPNWRNA